MSSYFSPLLGATVTKAISYFHPGEINKATLVWCEAEDIGFNGGRKHNVEKKVVLLVTLTVSSIVFSIEYVPDLALTSWIVHVGMLHYLQLNLIETFLLALIQCSQGICEKFTQLTKSCRNAAFGGMQLSNWNDTARNFQ